MQEQESILSQISNLSTMNPKFKLIHSQGNPSSLVMLSPVQKLVQRLQPPIINNIVFVYSCTDQNNDFLQAIQKTTNTFKQNNNDYKFIKFINLKSTVNQILSLQREIQARLYIVLIFTAQKVSEMKYLSQVRCFKIIEKIYYQPKPIQNQQQNYQADQNDQCMSIKVSNSTQLNNKCNQIIDDPKQYNQDKNKEKQKYQVFPNFISLNQNVQFSNLLVKTMYVMYNIQLDQNQVNQIKEQLECLFDRLAQKNKKFYEKKDDWDLFMKDFVVIQKAIMWYTKQSPVSKIINNLLRTAYSPGQFFYIQPYFKNLAKAVKNICKQYQKTNQARVFICYRGGYVSQSEIDKFYRNVGGFVQTLSFLSTSLSIQMAQKFIGNAFFQIMVDTSKIQFKDTFGYAYIKSKSQFIGEEQILFNPLNTFRVLQVQQKYIEPHQKDYLIKLQYGSLENLLFEDQKDLTENQKYWKNLKQLQLAKRQQIKWQGSIFSVQYRFEGYLQYWNRYIYLSQVQLKKFQDNKSKEYKQMIKKQALGRYNIGKYYIYINLLQDAKKQYKAILKLLSEKSMQKTFLYAQTCSCLGRLYLKINCIQKAQFYLNSTLTILKQKQAYQKNDLYAICLKDLAHLHLFMYRSDKAQEYLLQYLQVRKNWLWDQTYAKALNIIGQIYQEKGYYTKACECFKKSLKIISFLYGDLCKQYEIILYNIAGNLQKRGYLQKSLEIYKQVMQRTTFLHELSGINISKLLLKIGQIYQQKKQLKKAAVYYDKAQITLQKYYKDKHMVQAEILNKKSSILLKNDQFEQAIYYLEKSLSIRLKLLSQNANYYQQNNLQNGMKQITQNIKISNMQYLNALIINIQIILFKTNKKITMYCLQAQKILNTFPDHMNINFIAIYSIIGFGYAIQKKYHRAYQYFIISLKIAQRFYGNKYRNYGYILDSIRTMKTYIAFMEKGGLNLQQQLLRIPSVDQIVYFNKGQFSQLIKLYMRSIIYNSYFQNIWRLKQLYEKIGEKHLFNKFISKFVKIVRIYQIKSLPISTNKQPISQPEKINNLSFKSNNDYIFKKMFRTQMQSKYNQAPLNIQSLNLEQLKFRNKKKAKKFTIYLDLMVAY